MTVYNIGRDIHQRKVLMLECPFNRDICDSACSLYIKPEDINESMLNKLASIGVFSRTEGTCSFRVIALAHARELYENTNTNPSLR